MALPFILGVAVGAGAIIAYNKNKKIQDKTDEIIEKSKDLASDMKKNIDSAVDCVKDKIDKNEKTIVKEEKSGDS